MTSILLVLWPTIIGLLGVAAMIGFYIGKRAAERELNGKLPLYKMGDPALWHVCIVPEHSEHCADDFYSVPKDTH